jgi:hypothetical protein
MPNTIALVSMDDLAQWLTAEVRKFEGCEECLVTGVYRLAAPDEDGCNWSMGYMRATGVPRAILDPAMSDVVSRARQSFNPSD